MLVTKGGALLLMFFLLACGHDGDHHEMDGDHQEMDGDHQEMDGDHHDQSSPAAAVSTPSESQSPKLPAVLLELPTDEIKGIDVSEHQGIVEFDRVKCAGAAFVFVRASQGITFQDPLFDRNFEGAKSVGLLRGAYHYYMTDDDPYHQFVNFSSIVTLEPGDLPPVVDIEALAKNSLPNLRDELKIFLDELEKFYGVKPIIYSGERFANDDLIGFGDYPLWLAEYGVPEPKIPQGWSTWHFWQYSQSLELDGVGGPVDGSSFHSSGDELVSLLIKHRTEATP